VKVIVYACSRLLLYKPVVAQLACHIVSPLMELRYSLQANGPDECYPHLHATNIED